MALFVVQQKLRFGNSVPNIKFVVSNKIQVKSVGLTLLRVCIIIATLNETC